jgi:hypothetical protein
VGFMCLHSWSRRPRSQSLLRSRLGRMWLVNAIQKKLLGEFQWNLAGMFYGTCFSPDLTFGWPWPNFKVTKGHWPSFALYTITQVIIKLGSSDFAWMFPKTRLSFSICMVDHDLVLRSLEVIDLISHYTQ